MAIPARTLKTWLLALCALSLALFAYDIVTIPQFFAEDGIRIIGSAKPFLYRIKAPQDRPAYAAGIRSTDLLDERLWTTTQRAAPRRVGEPVVFTLRSTADGPSRTVSVTPTYDEPGFTDWITFVSIVWTLGFGAVLASRRTQQSDAPLLAGALISFTLLLTTSYFVTPLPVISFIFYILHLLAVATFRTLPVLYAIRLGKSRWLTALALLTFVTIIVAFGGNLVLGITFFAGTWDALPYNRLLPGAFLYSGAICPLLQTLCLVGAVFATHDRERARIAWVAAAFTPFWMFNFVVFVGNALGSPMPGWIYAYAAATFAVPVVLTYALLSRRLLDVGFALNRAAVFSVVSIVLVGAFVLAEWAITEWMRDASHTTNVIISGCLALALGMSVRVVHVRVDKVVDNVFFRKRHENELALRLFASEAPYITDRDLLLSRTANVIRRHTDASSVDILLNEAAYFGALTENDPLIVRLKATNGVVPLHDVESSVKGELAYPMIVRGQLSGVLVLGPRESGEAYAPDESEAIARIAHSVAVSLDVLERSAGGQQDQLLAAIQALPDAIAQRLRLTT